MEKDASGSDRWSSVSSIGTRVVHPFKENFAFGRLLIPVLARQIQDPDPSFRKRAMHSLKEALFDPRNAACLNKTDIIISFQKLTKDNDSEIRMLLAEIFLSLTSSSVGRGFFVANSIFNQAFDLLFDDNGMIRNIVYRALNQLLITPIGVQALISAGVVPNLLRRLVSEPMLNQAEVLNVLHHCTKLKPEQAVEVQAVKILLPLLETPCPRIRELAAAVLLDIAVDGERGKQQVVDYGGIPALLRLCTDEDPRVVAKTVGALTMASNSTRAKIELFENSAIEKLLPLLDSNDLEIRLNCLKLLASLAEMPQGKRLLQQNIGQLLKLKIDSSIEVQLAVKKAVSVIESVPM